MIILEKVKEIVIFKFMGIIVVGIWCMFFVLGSFIGFIGSVVGFMVGFGICWVIKFFGFVLFR